MQNALVYDSNFVYKEIMFMLYLVVVKNCSFLLKLRNIGNTFVFWFLVNIIFNSVFLVLCKI